MTENEKALMLKYFEYLSAFNFKGELRLKSDYPSCYELKAHTSSVAKKNPYRWKRNFRRAEILSNL